MLRLCYGYGYLIGDMHEHDRAMHGTWIWFSYCKLLFSGGIDCVNRPPVEQKTLKQGSGVV
jgi:hypothetical protein